MTIYYSQIVFVGNIKIISVAVAWQERENNEMYQNINKEAAYRAASGYLKNITLINLFFNELLSFQQVVVFTIYLDQVHTAYKVAYINVLSIFLSH
jgi:hypothetical protein